MGQIVRRKRRGRPSNTDRARRNSFAAQPPPSPADRRRRSRRRRNVRYSFDIDDYVDDDEFYDDDDDEDEEEVGRREKKLRLLLCEDDSKSQQQRRVGHAPSYSSSDDDYDEDDDGSKALKKRKLGDEEEDDEDDNEIEERRGRNLEEEEDDEDEEEEEAGGRNFVCGTASGLQKEVTLPDKKTLQFILDKLQKKDIYGVYAEPVDPEELPDYHDVIKHPMDFATIRKKLAKGMYLTLNEVENDVLLLCRNAMQYNAPDTIYYKQASSIREQAKLRFQRLRANGDRSETELKTEQKTTPSFSLPKKQLKKPVAQTPEDPVGSETFPNGSSGPTPSVRPNSGEMLIAENSSLPENNLDKEQELLPGKSFMSKVGRKPSVHDENRRATYNISVQPVTESTSIFSTFENESKHFIPVGLHSEHSYARSLARFAATLGSVAWKVASQTIERALPEGVKFGRGWVGEYEPLPTPVLMPENRTMSEPDFLANIKIDGKSSKNTASSNDQARKSPPVEKGLNEDGCGSQKLPVFSNTTIGNGAKIPLNQESPREADKNLRPHFFSSLQVNPAFSGSNLLRQNDVPSRKFNRPEKEGSPLAEQKTNHPLTTHVSSTDFVTKRLVSNVSDIPSTRPAKPVSQNENLVSLASFKHPNGTNDGFSPKGKPTPVFPDSNRMVPIENNLPYQPERKPTSLSRDYNRMAPIDNNLPYQQERKPTSVSRDFNRMVPMDNNLPHQQQCVGDPVQMMKMLAEKAQHQQNKSNGFGAGSISPVGPKREDSNKDASPIPQFPSKPQHQQIYLNGSQIGSRRDDSSNVALTAAQAWMSLGGTGGFVKPPLTQNPSPHKISTESLYNQQPQVSRFRGEFPVPGIQNYQQPVHAFVPQPVRTTNEARFQNRQTGFPQLVTADLSRFQAQSGWRGVAPQLQNQSRPKQQESRPPDLNVGFQSMGSPVRQSTAMLVDSQQPDLALQL